MISQQPLQRSLTERAISTFQKTELVDFLDPIQKPVARAVCTMIARRENRLRGVFSLEHSRRMRHANEKHRVLTGFSRGLVNGPTGMLLEHVIDVLQTGEFTVANGVDSLVQPTDRRPERNTIVTNFARTLQLLEH